MYRGNRRSKKFSLGVVVIQILMLLFLYLLRGRNGLGFGQVFTCISSVPKTQDIGAF